jgi:methionyl-tRNA formyltransferase
MRTLFLGYSEMGCAGLETLLECGAEVVAVYTHEDDPAEKRWYRSVADIAAANGIPVFRAPDINAPEEVSRIRGLAPEILLSFYYRRIVRPEILAIPPKGCLNLHGSLLPKYRGRVPTNWAIIHGETETGVTLHEMVKRADAGAIVAQKAVAIGPDDRAIDVMMRQVGACRELVRGIWPRLVDGTAPRVPQDEAAATKFPGRKPADGEIDWTRSAKEVHDLVRAVTDPYPGAGTELDGRRVTVWWGRPIEDEGPYAAATPGTVVETTPDGPVLKCGHGLYAITRRG